jgi:hypothetical protein
LEPNFDKIVIRWSSSRSPGSKLLSITTQLHCGGHFGGRAQLPDTILEEDHPMTIPSKFGSNCATGSRQESLNCKHVQHVKIYLPCNFEVNRITHLGVIALFSSNFYNFNTVRLIFKKIITLHTVVRHFQLWVTFL